MSVTSLGLARTSQLRLIVCAAATIGLACAGEDVRPDVPAQNAEQSLPRVSGPSPFVADCNGPGFPITAAYVNAEVEPYVAINPRDPSNVIAVYQQDRYPNDRANGVLASASFDAGRSWQVPELKDQPQFSRCASGSEAPEGDFEQASDPWVAFGPDGIAYFAAPAFDQATTAELVSTSTDGGRTWQRPIVVIQGNDPAQRNLRPAVTADPKRPGTAYLVWTRSRRAPTYQAGGTAFFSRTTDGGKAWSEARAIYESPIGMGNSGNEIVVMPNGDLVNVFKEMAPGTGPDPRRDRSAAMRSGDGGLTWSEPTTVASSEVVDVNDPGTGARIRTGSSFTDIAVDPRPGTQAIYAVWEDARFTQGRTQQIALAKSTDGGLTWSDPIAVSTDPGAQAFVPSVAVNDSGDVAVTYYGFSAGKSDSRALMTQYWITLSKDGGQTWTTRQPVTRQPFDMRTAPFNSGFFLGEYVGLAGAGQSFVVVAPFTNGRSLDNRTDVFSCTVTLGSDDNALPLQGGSASPGAVACQ